MPCGYVYILTNDRKTTLYIGFTTNLKNRIYLHRKRLVPGFSKKYNLTRLVWFEEFSSVTAARKRESTLKGGSRNRKNALISSQNPHWADLYPSIATSPPDMKK
jgi:putative endonuclease